MLHSILQKGKCRIGLHAGEWSYVADGACEQQRVCVHCETRSLQTTHDWQEWARPDPDACRLTRACARCGDEEERIEHAWAPEAYTAEGSCARARHCSRCEASEPAAAVHVWDAWTYARDDACEQTLSCSRCGQGATNTRTEHDWGPWATSDYYDARVCVCRRCAEMVLSFDRDDDFASAVSFQATGRAASAVLEAPDAATLRDRLVAERELLFGPAFDAYLRFSIDRPASEDDERRGLGDLARLIQRCRVEGIDAVCAVPEPVAEPEATQTPVPTHGRRPPGMCGHWRSTEILGAGSGMSLTTDTHMVLEEDGRFAWWSSGSPHPEGGSWSCSGDVLSLSFDDSSELSWQFTRSGGQMSFPGTRYAYWERL